MLKSGTYLIGAALFLSAAVTAQAQDSATPAAAGTAPAPAKKASALSALDPAEIAARIANDPASPKVSGAKAKLVDDARVQGGKAVRIQVAAKGKNPWDASVTSPVTKAVKAGDALLLIFWARLEKGEDGAASAPLPFNAVQQSAEPWSPVINGPADLGPDWKLFEIQGKSDKDYAAGALNVTLQLATAKQTIDLGPVILLNLGQGTP